MSGPQPHVTHLQYVQPLPLAPGRQAEPCIEQVHEQCSRHLANARETMKLQLACSICRPSPWSAGTKLNLAMRSSMAEIVSSC